MTAYELKLESDLRIAKKQLEASKIRQNYERSRAEKAERKLEETYKQNEGLIKLIAAYDAKQRAQLTNANSMDYAMLNGALSHLRNIVGSADNIKGTIEHILKEADK